LLTERGFHNELILLYRVQKNRATKSEDAVEHLNAQLMERDAIMAEQRSELDTLRARCDKLCREKAQSLAENVGLKTWVAVSLIPH